MFRANDLNGKEVKGWLFIPRYKNIGEAFIIPHSDAYHVSPSAFVGRFVEIDPKTLAMNTTVKDKNGKPIFGSFEYEPGKMSEGGDRIYTGFYQATVVFKNGAFVLEQGGCSVDCLGEFRVGALEIIGPACEGDK